MKTTWTLALVACLALALVAPLAEAHPPSRAAGTPFALDYSCRTLTANCHIGVCWYGQLQPGYWECYGTWADGSVNCAYGHWYWNVENGANHFWCYA